MKNLINTHRKNIQVKWKQKAKKQKMETQLCQTINLLNNINHSYLQHSLDRSREY